MDKSTRKRQKCIKSAISAGDKAKSHCPPSLDASLKRALQQEIKAFSAKKVQADARKEAAISAAGGPSADAYQRWLEQNGGREPTEANPDVLSEDDGIKYLLSKKDPKFEGFLKEVRQTFSPRELRAWNMIMKHNMTYQETADLLSLPVGAVQTLLKRAKMKFIRYMEACKRA